MPHKHLLRFADPEAHGGLLTPPTVTLSTSLGSERAKRELHTNLWGQEPRFEGYPLKTTREDQRPRAVSTSDEVDPSEPLLYLLSAPISRMVTQMETRYAMRGCSNRIGGQPHERKPDSIQHCFRRTESFFVLAHCANGRTFTSCKTTRFELIARGQEIARTCNLPINDEPRRFDQKFYLGLWSPHNDV